MKNIEVVILANSVKHNQHCVAGKCVTNGQWIRPVSNIHGAELSHTQAQCKNPYGTFNVKPLQKVYMGLSTHAPLSHQPENYLIDCSVWRQNYRIPNQDLDQYLDEPDDLWGSADRVPYARIASGDLVIEQSLYLVAVKKLNLYRNQYNRRRASFLYGGINYDLAVTDPNVDSVIDGNQNVKGILCVSLGEVYQGSCFKIVAGIL